MLAWAVGRGRGADVSALLRGVLDLVLAARRARRGPGLGSQGSGLRRRGRSARPGLACTLGGAFGVLQGDFEASARDLVSVKPLLTEAGDRLGVATVDLVLGWPPRCTRGRPSRRRAWRRRSTFEELNDLWGIGTALHAIRRVRTIYDDFAGAGDLFERTLAAASASATTWDAFGEPRDGPFRGGRPRERAEVLVRLLEHMRATNITYAGDALLDVLALLCARRRRRRKGDRAAPPRPTPASA